ncbi:hypothetical protein QE408_001303 [Agrobacterium larrymoorei]|uniref:Uncharacterized protein n=1 Tax=Agrobacterium larrymoorei TaxID=160699 RepID=A0ABU0UGV4_9HYPH|nr:hypothetical protein [Agrobacterium larrymoorei]
MTYRSKIWILSCVVSLSLWSIGIQGVVKLTQAKDVLSPDSLKTASTR